MPCPAVGGHGPCLGRNSLGLASDVGETFSTKPLYHSMLLLVPKTREMRAVLAVTYFNPGRSSVVMAFSLWYLPEAKSGKLCATRCKSTGLNFPDACV